MLLVVVNKFVSHLFDEFRFCCHFLFSFQKQRILSLTCNLARYRRRTMGITLSLDDPRSTRAEGRRPILLPHLEVLSNATHCTRPITSAPAETRNDDLPSSVTPLADPQQTATRPNSELVREEQGSPIALLDAFETERASPSSWASPVLGFDFGRQRHGRDSLMTVLPLLPDEGFVEDEWPSQEDNWQLQAGHDVLRKHGIPGGLLSDGTYAATARVATSSLSCISIGEDFREHEARDDLLQLDGFRSMNSSAAICPPPLALDPK